MRLGHWIEAAAARGALRLLRGLGAERASNLGGAVARAIGPLLPVSRVADHNLRRAMPELDRAARRRVVRGVWNNLGRTAGEFPHLGRMQETASGPGWELEGGEHVRAIARAGGPAILFTGHVGNWEVMPRATVLLGVRGATMYRPSENQAIDELVLQLRNEAQGGSATLFAKGAQGARQMLLHLKNGGYLGVLQDQKMNDGIESRFFGHTAMTASATAAMALRLGCPLLPGHVRRVGPARFRIRYDPPLPLPDTGDRRQDVAILTQAINDRIESWIREWPEGWLWLHRRWTRDFYQGL